MMTVEKCLEKAFDCLVRGDQAGMEEWSLMAGRLMRDEVLEVERGGKVVVSKGED